MHLFTFEFELLDSMPIKSNYHSDTHYYFYFPLLNRESSVDKMIRWSVKLRGWFFKFGSKSKVEEVVNLNCEIFRNLFAL